MPRGTRVEGQRKEKRLKVTAGLHGHRGIPHCLLGAPRQITTSQRVRTERGRQQGIIRKKTN
ncbi:hypothetical protein E2562_034094 [Oryza meyeriana var. granulata]|uniref:Uncharacterized protein n=1 Tax=Oryza meyeriana var. granulata TaxID=110450 RepID=A0A6G1E6Y2_9ORYZ|nr:hypothetical protein E2562_034094 [Oryza meyeriana var. granulata]KAF0920242.1 hypothetical protein E2562_034094 [Oryza meyeriana var. granulata]